MTRRTIEFGEYFFDTRALTLSNAGQVVPLRLQAANLLKLLLRAAPEYLSRQEIREALWEKHTTVDVDGALNAVVRELRAALGDTAEEQRFIETLPKRGYRFCHELTDHRPAKRNGRRRRIAGAFVAMLGTVALAYLAGIGKSVPEPVRLAVLPGVQLDTTGGEPSIAYRATAGLLTVLRGISGEQLVVVGSENVRRFGADSVLDTAGIAADYFLETDAMQDGGSLDVVATLRSRNASVEVRRFQKAYSLENASGEVAGTVQRDLIQWICEALNLSNDGSLFDADRAVAENVDALIRARWLREQDEISRQLDALALYEDVLEDHPRNAEALSGKLLVLIRVADFFGHRRRQVMDDIEALSLQLSEDRLASGGMADLGIAFVRQYRDWDLDAARRHAEAAIALDPHNPQAHVAYSAVKAATGDLDGAIESAEIALRILPDRWARIDLCFYLVLSAEYARARDFCSWAHQEIPSGTYFGVQAAFAAYRLGDERQAVDQMIDLVRISDPVAADRLAEQQPSWQEYGCLRAEYFTARAQADGIEKTNVPFTSITYFWAQCGKKKELLVWMQRAIDARELTVTFFPFDTRFDEWRSDPDFLAMLSQISGG